MAELTKITTQVIAANAITEAKISNASINTRHIADYAVQEIHLDPSINVTAAAITANANDYATYVQLTTDYEAADSSNLLTARSNDYSTYTAVIAVTDDITGGSTPFTVAKTFNSDVLVQGDFIVEGNTFTANVGTIQYEDSNLVLNHGGTNTTAILGGIEMEGTSAQLIGAIRFDTDSVSDWRLGTGSLGAADDIARAGDYQANDFTTFDTARANDYATFEHLNANINVVSGNVDSMAGVNLHSFYNTYSTSGSNVFFLGSISASPDANHVSLYLDSVFQPQAEWVYNSGNNSVQFKDSTLASGLDFTSVNWATD